MVKQASMKKLIAKAMYAVAFTMPATNIPQITQLFSSRIATGLSLQTWVMYLAVGTIPLLYAIAYKMKPLIISNILWSIVDIVMIYGIVRFGMLAQDNDMGYLLLINDIGKTINGLGLILISSALVLLAQNMLMQKSAQR